jgi:aminoglycoside phosphotransferase family enzyme
MTIAAATGLADKVAFLSDARSYPVPTRRVQAVETHMSWVFLTEAHAWKLKKPERIDGIDLGSVEARHRHCRMEIRLNRRFTDDVYLEAVALRADAARGFSFGGDEPVLDWLVKMRRLPARLMLDRLIAAGAVRPRDVRALARLLARFYLTCAPEPITGAAFRARLAARIRGIEGELHRLRAFLPAAPVQDDLGERLEAFLALEAGMFDERVDEGRVVEGHGDLRPEHVCLETQPRIIDCLEFSRELRIVDAAEELGYLALECERLGAPGLRETLFAAYEEASGDRPDGRMVHFYQAMHACARAWLALRHLSDAAPREPAHWPLLAADYLRLASEHAAHCAIPKL